MLEEDTLLTQMSGHVSLLYFLSGRYTSVFGNDVHSLFSFCNLWWDEIHTQLLAKGFFLIKDARSPNAAAYSDFTSV
jgi:hypothetical protein